MDHVRCPGGGKVCYGTRADAMQARRSINTAGDRHGRQRDQNLVVYECRRCGLWHVGHDKLAPRRGDRS